MNASSNPYNPDLSWVPCTELVTDDDFDALPVQFRHDVTLSCTPEQLFAIFEDPESWPRWATGIGGVEWTSEKPFGVGTTRTVRFWGGMEVYERFTAWETGRHMAFTFVGTSEAVWTSFGERYYVEPVGDGCRLVWKISYAPTGGFGQVHPLLKPVMGFNLGTYLWFLRRYVSKRFG